MKSVFSTAVCVLGLTLCVGCGGGEEGPELGQVSGVVTLDGQPVASADVTFTPDQGRPSMGQTDDEGKYRLRYSAESDGALPGMHSVSISTQRDQTGGEGDQPLVPAQEERIPAKYNEETELSREVSAGENTIDFELTSE